MTQHRVIYNEGAQTLRHVPVDRRGRVVRVSSATYAIVDLRHPEDGSERAIASGSATVGAVSTALTASAGAGTADPAVIPVTSATGITAGHTYALSTATGRTESFVVARVDSLNVYATHELVGDYTTSDSVVSVELTASFPSDEADEEPSVWDGGGPYQISWEYTIEDQLYLVPEIVWLTRYSVQPFVTERDVLTLHPTLGTLSRRRVTIPDAIAAATRAFVAEVESAQRDPTLYRPTNLAREAVCEKAVAFVLEWCDRADDAATHDERFRRYVNQMLVGSPKTGAVTTSRADDSATAGGDRRQQGRFVKRG